MNEEYFEIRENENEIAIRSLTEKLTKEEQSIKTDTNSCEKSSNGKSKPKKVKKKHRKCPFIGCNGSGNTIEGKAAPLTHYT